MRPLGFSSRFVVTLAVWTLSIACSAPMEPVPVQTAGTQSTEEPPEEGAADGEIRLRTVYVPAYSHMVRGGKGVRPTMLSVLLSVRNMDTTSAVTLTHVDYFDTSGHRVRRYLDAPRQLRPLETAEFLVPTSDEVGGSGANFLVYWEGPSDCHALLTETVMVGNMGAGYMAFTSRGVELDRRPSPGAYPLEPAAK